MKTSIVTLLAACVLLMGTCATYGGTYYWDNNGLEGGFGAAAGTWGVDPNWSADSSGTSEPVITNTTAVDDLHFGTSSGGLGSGTIMVDGTEQAFRSMTFGAASGRLTLSGGSLALADPYSEILSDNAYSNTISAVLTGTHGLSVAFPVTTLTSPLFLKAESSTLFTNAILSQYVDVRATMMGGSVATTATTPFSFVHNGTNIIVQMQVRDGTWTKCIKIELTQNNTDIAGRVLYVKYSAELPGFNFDTGGNTGTLASSGSVPGYGITQISLVDTDGHVLILNGTNTYSGNTAIGSGTLVIGEEGRLGGGTYGGSITNDGQFRFCSASDQQLSGTLSGAGSLVMDAQTKHIVPITYANFLTSSQTLIIPKAVLSDCFGAGGRMGGASINSGSASVPADAYFFTNNGQSVTYQMQIYEGEATKCVKVELAQSGAGITAIGRYAKYVFGNQLGFDFDQGGTLLDIATSLVTTHYGVAETTLNFLIPSQLTLSGANRYSGGTVVNGGILEVTATNAALPFTGQVTVNNGGELVLNAVILSHLLPGVGNLTPITINRGGTLTLAKPHNVGASRPVIINGGTLQSTAHDDYDCVNYVNNLTLQNGARVTGYKLRMGGFDVPASLIVSGTNASSIEAGISMVKLSSQSLSTLIVNVADVTGTPEPDLVISGVIRDYSSTLTGLPVFKTGAGTLLLSNANTHIGPITVTQGVLALGANQALNTDNPLTLNGGKLEMGSFTNAVGTLTLAKNSEIALGSGSLAFANSSAKTWSGTLTLSGTLGPKTLRFGTSENALTVQQLAAITFDGSRVQLKSDGYLAPWPRGTCLLVR